MKKVALLSILERERRGLLFKTWVLNRMAPFFCAPRLQRVIRLKEVGLSGFQILMPLGSTNWAQLSEPLKSYLLTKTQRLFTQNHLSSLAISRNLNVQMPPDLPGRDGDFFIGALAVLRMEYHLDHLPVHRIVIAGDKPLALSLAALITERFRLPVLIQSLSPARIEPAAMRLLYYEGVPIPLAVFDPGSWRKNDMIIFLGEYYAHKGSSFISGCKLDLTDGSFGHAPRVEEALYYQGIKPTLQNLAPLMEAHLLEQSEFGLNFKETVKVIGERGKGLWYYFLDKDHVGHYNTLKGF